MLCVYMYVNVCVMDICIVCYYFYVVKYFWVFYVLCFDVIVIMSICGGVKCFILFIYFMFSLL